MHVSEEQMEKHLRIDILETRVQRIVLLFRSHLTFIICQLIAIVWTNIFIIYKYHTHEREMIYTYKCINLYNLTYSQRVVYNV